jgi:hypothetical protein
MRGFLWMVGVGVLSEQGLRACGQQKRDGEEENGRSGSGMRYCA